MEVKQKSNKAVTFILKCSTDDLLKEICKNLNDQLTIKVSKSQIVDILIQDAKRRDMSRLLLTY